MNENPYVSVGSFTYTLKEIMDNPKYNPGLYFSKEELKQAQLAILDRIEKSDSYNPNYTHPEVKDWLISKEELTRLRKELE